MVIKHVSCRHFRSKVGNETAKKKTRKENSNANKAKDTSCGIFCKFTRRSVRDRKTSNLDKKGRKNIYGTSRGPSIAATVYSVPKSWQLKVIVAAKLT
jgi:hypothetical protein